MNNDFDVYSLLDAIDTQEHASSQQDIDHMYRLVMQKAGLPVRRNRRPKTYLLLAAVVACGLLAVAASYFSASDALRGHLDEHGQGGQAVTLSGASEIVDRAGRVLENQISISDNIEISARAVAGDDGVFVVLFDLERMTGQPLALLQEDGSLSEESFYFGQVNVVPLVRNEPFPGMGASVMHSTTSGDKGTVLLRVELDNPILIGETVDITLGSLQQLATLPGIDAGLAPGELRDMVASFPAVGPDDFRESGYYYSSESELSETLYDLDADSGVEIALPGLLEGYVLTNATVEHGKLYFKIYGPFEHHSSSLLSNLAIVAGDGTLLSSKSLSMTSDQRDGVQVSSWSVRFEDVPSLDLLEGCTLLVHYGFGHHAVSGGTWSFQIKLDYENSTRSYPANQKLTMYSQEVTLTNVHLSPFRLRLDLVPQDNSLDCIDDIMNYLIDEPLEIHMKDGSVVETSSKSCRPEFQGEGDNERVVGFQFDSPLDAVLDPDLVDFITLGDLQHKIQ